MPSPIPLIERTPTMRKHWSMRWRTSSRRCVDVSASLAHAKEHLARHRPDIVLVAQQTAGGSCLNFCNSSTAYLR